jgi:ribose 5-phosphate isomerase B
MKIAIGTDHRGLAHRDALAARLREAGHVVTDCGGQAPGPIDYPAPALAVGRLVAGGGADLGVLVCGSGIGVSIAANKVRGVRAALCHTPEQAAGTRRHNDANVLCLSGDAVNPAQAVAILDAFLATGFEGGRHADRVRMITEYENGRTTGE